MCECKLALLFETFSIEDYRRFFYAKLFFGHFLRFRFSYLFFSLAGFKPKPARSPGGAAAVVIHAWQVRFPTRGGGAGGVVNRSSGAAVDCPVTATGP